MNFVKHYNLEGKHAPFSASQPAWLRYTDDKTLQSFVNKKASERGTKLHEWAKQTIDLGIRQPEETKTLSMYINDAIGFRMRTEVVLYYSDRFFGTADAISFNDNLLRVHDLKTGVGPVHTDQLLVYAALFCLEYKLKPGMLKFELRMYQNDAIDILQPTAEDIVPIMDLIIHRDKLLEQIDSKEV